MAPTRMVPTRMAAAAALALLLAASLAGCGQPDDLYDGPPIPLTVRTFRDADACCAASGLPDRAPAAGGFVRLVFAHDDALEAPKLKRRQVEFDPGCRPAAEGPDCSGLQAAPEYRVGRMAAGAFWTDWYPLDANGTVRLVLPEPMTASIALTGRIADGYPQVAQQPACAASQYFADRLLAHSGGAEDRSTPTSLPKLRVEGPAAAAVGWRMFAGCGGPAPAATA